MARRNRTVGLDAGARDRRVTIQQLVETKGTSGFPVEDWIPLIDMDASRAEVSGFERFVAAAQLSAPYETRWGIDYRPDMDPDLVDVPKKRRVVYQGRVHDIVAAELVGREMGVELLTLSRRG